MNARSTNRPGGRGRPRKGRVRRGGKAKGCLLLLVLALAVVSAVVLAVAR